MPIRVFKGAHLPTDLDEKFADLLRWCDILFLEEAANDDHEEKKELLNCLSGNRPTQYALIPSLFDEFKSKLKDSFIKNSCKQIELEHSPFSALDIEKIDRRLFDAQDAYCSGLLDDAISRKIEYASCLNNFQIKRDYQLCYQLSDLFKESPDKNILAISGGNHYFDVFLQRSGIPIERIFSRLPLVFISDDELVRKMRFFKPYSTELVARTFPEEIISDYLLDDDHANYADVVKKIRNISERLSYEDIKSLSAYIAKNSGSLKTVDEVCGCTLTWLTKKGITV